MSAILTLKRFTRFSGASLVRACLLLLVLAVPLCGVASAQSKPPRFPMQGRDLGESLGNANTPEQRILKQVAFDQRLNEQVPLDLVFRDETGNPARLDRFFGERPVILALVQYECPMLCTEILNGLLHSVDELQFDAGKEFDIVVVSIDHRETSALATEKKEQYLRRYARAGASDGWHFLTGDEQTIARLADAIGYRFVFNEERNQYAHPSGVVVATPTGRISHYFYGVQYEARDLRLSLVEASANKIGSRIDQIMLYCYHYDPTTGKYGIVIMNIIRVFGGITVLALVLSILVMLRGDRGSKAPVEAPGLSEG